MTPSEVRAMDVPEYLALNVHMHDDLKEQKRQADKARSRRKR